MLTPGGGTVVGDDRSDCGVDGHDGLLVAEY